MERVGQYCVNKIGPGRYVVTHIVSPGFKKLLPIKGCSRCVKDTKVVHWLGNTVDIIDESQKPGYAIFVKECWNVKKDFAEKMLAIRTCPKCNAILEEGEYLLYYPTCNVCNLPLSSRDFCVHCGLGMAPGLFEDLHRKGLDPIMVA